jgi:feruloyl esterase
VLHCGGGNGPIDMGERTRAKMIEWVEHGVAPGALVATRPGETGVRQFLICPYPDVAVFNGAPSSNSDPMAGYMFSDPAFNAGNWSCRPPGAATHADAGRIEAPPWSLARLDRR